MTKKIWYLRYVVGNPQMFTQVTDCADNPMTRAQALDGYATVAGNSRTWRVWVENAKGERIAESEAEIQWRNGES